MDQETDLGEHVDRQLLMLDGVNAEELALNGGSGITYR